MARAVASRTLRALRHRNFQLFFAGQLISLIGTWMQSVAQSWLVYRLTGSSALLGLVAFAGQIPIFLLAPIGGYAADRMKRHRMVIATQVSSMVLALILAALTLGDGFRFGSCSSSRPFSASLTPSIFRRGNRSWSRWWGGRIS